MNQYINFNEFNNFVNTNINYSSNFDIEELILSELKKYNKENNDVLKIFIEDTESIDIYLLKFFIEFAKKNNFFSNSIVLDFPDINILTDEKTYNNIIYNRYALKDFCNCNIGTEKFCLQDKKYSLINKKTKNDIYQIYLYGSLDFITKKLDMYFTNDINFSDLENMQITINPDNDFIYNDITVNKFLTLLKNKPFIKDYIFFMPELNSHKNFENDKNLLLKKIKLKNIKKLQEEKIIMFETSSFSPSTFSKNIDTNTSLEDVLNNFKLISKHQKSIMKNILFTVTLDKILDSENFIKFIKEFKTIFGQKIDIKVMLSMNDSNEYNYSMSKVLTDAEIQSIQTLNANLISIGVKNGIENKIKEDIFSFDELIVANKKLNKIINTINSSKVENRDLTPLEKYIMAYRYVKDFVYKAETKGESLYQSRNVIKVLNSDRIVCCGYAGMLDIICKNIGIDCAAIGVLVDDENNKNDIKVPYSKDETNHRTNMVNLVDKTYDVDGIFYADACGDSSYLIKDNPSFFKKKNSETQYKKQSSGYAHSLIPFNNLKCNKNIIKVRKLYTNSKFLKDNTELVDLKNDKFYTSTYKGTKAPSLENMTKALLNVEIVLNNGILDENCIKRVISEIERSYDFSEEFFHTPPDNFIFKNNYSESEKEYDAILIKLNNLLKKCKKSKNIVKIDL